jgi:hypothetical protein
MDREEKQGEKSELLRKARGRGRLDWRIPYCHEEWREFERKGQPRRKWWWMSR